MLIQHHPTRWIKNTRCICGLCWVMLGQQIMPIRIYCPFGQLFLSFYKMVSQSGEVVEQTKETIKNGKNKWTYDEVQDLIELLKEKPCSWNIFSNDYTKREVKERTYAELAVRHK